MNKSDGPESFIASYNPQWGLPSGEDEWALTWTVTGIILLVALVIVIALRRRQARAQRQLRAELPPGREGERRR